VQFACYQQAASSGHSPAEFALAVCYEKGRGVEKDPAKAIEIFMQAAEHGDAAAQFKLGEAYYYGRYRSCLSIKSNRHRLRSRSIHDWFGAGISQYGVLPSMSTSI
jgi:TPR repeat protein